MKKCTFVTSCWEEDWEKILLRPDYLKTKQIANHQFPFDEKLLVINNVKNLPAVKRAAQEKIDQGVLTRFVATEEIEDEVMEFFQLKREDFRPQGVNLDWIYYNALAPLTAIYATNTPYLLYLTGDVYLDQPVSWIEKAMRLLERKPQCKVANLTWNHNYKEARKEAYKTSWNFFFSRKGFSDQMFLVKREDFRAPIYGEVREDTSHFPRGDVFERRVFSFMKNRGWERITFRRGSYTHK
jgi:hypothetical protein